MTYAELKQKIIEWLRVSDAPAADFILLAEAQFMRDRRARKLHTIDLDTVANNSQVTLPTDFQGLHAWYYDETPFGAVSLVTPDQLSDLHRVYKANGRPKYVTLEDTVANLVPTPDLNYSMKMQYWQVITKLSDSNTTNWISINHPDIYMFGALMQSPAFLKQDERLPMWTERYEAAMEELSAYTENKLIGGSFRRHFTPIGG